ncbi:MAG TPA: SPOR domain-containing protein [Spirochaetia bacterium]|nr:SPOR domain-containing protein [Spirochaetia bacterium]
MKKSRVVVIIVLIVSVLCVFASSWDGSAIVGAYGDFPLQGYYGACNSFPRNTIIDVTNLANNKTVTIIITRELATTGILIALSPEAAQELGIIAGTTAIVRLTNPRMTGQTLGSVNSSVSGTDADDLKKKAETELARLGYAVTAPVSAPQTGVPQTTTQTQPQTQHVQPDTSQTRIVPQQSQVVGMPVPETKPETTAQPVRPQAPSTQPTATQPATAQPAGASTPSEQPQVYDGKPKPIRTIIISGLPVPDAKPGQVAAQPVTPAQQLTAPQPQTTQIPEAVVQQPQQMQAVMAQPELYTLISIPLNQVVKQKDIYAEPVPRSKESGISYVRQGAAIKPVDTPYMELPAPEREKALVLERLGLLGTSLAFNLPGYVEPLVNPAERATIIDKTWFQVTQNQPEVALLEPEVGQTEKGLVYDTRLFAPLPASVLADLADPDTTPEEQALLYALGLRSPFTSQATMDLLEPGLKESEKAVLYAYRFQQTVHEPVSVDLRDPLMAAEEIPVTYLGYQPLPDQTIPTVSLAESFVTVEDKNPSAILSYRKPYMQAAETVIQLETVPLQDPKQQVVTVVAPQSLPPGETVISMVPTTERPPQAVSPSTTSSSTAATKPQVTQQKPTAQAQIAQTTGSALEKGFFYIQIASFTTEEALQKAVQGLGNRYAVFIEKAVVKGKTVFRLYLGPLKKDETGVALMYARSLGYKDAFIKEGS